LAHSLKRLGRYEEELQARTRLIDTLESSPALVKGLHGEQKKRETAKWSCYLERSSAYRMLGRFKESLEDVTTAFELMPDHERSAVMPLFNRAASYMGLKQWNKALADFDDILDRVPDHRQSVLERVRILSFHTPLYPHTCPTSPYN